MKRKSKDGVMDFCSTFCDQSTKLEKKKKELNEDAPKRNESNERGNVIAG